MLFEIICFFTLHYFEFRYIEPHIPTVNSFLTNLSEKERNIPLKFRETLIIIEETCFYNKNIFDTSPMIRLHISAYNFISMSENLLTDPVQRRFIHNYTARLLFLKFNFGKLRHNIRRHAVEYLWSVKLNKIFSKNDILLLFSNLVYLGKINDENIHGFEHAGIKYWGKSLNDLNTDEIFGLIGLLASPSTYSPLKYPTRYHKQKQRMKEKYLKNRILKCSKK